MQLRLSFYEKFLQGVGENELPHSVTGSVSLIGFLCYRQLILTDFIETKFILN